MSNPCVDGAAALENCAAALGWAGPKISLLAEVIGAALADMPPGANRGGNRWLLCPARRIGGDRFCGECRGASRCAGIWDRERPPCAPEGGTESTGEAARARAM